MTQANLPLDEDNARFEREIDEVLSNANPNPARTGCPPRTVLSELARHKRGLDDPAWQHLLKCSPCYRDFLAFLKDCARPAASALLPWRDRRLAALAIALVLVAAFGGFWLSRRSAEPKAARSGNSASLSPTLRAEIDLRNYAVTRSEREPEGLLAPIQIPADVVELTLLLPVGAEPGPYDVQLLDPDLTSRASAHGTGERVNYIVTVKVSVDTRTVPAGNYQLAIRRVGDGWRMFPAQVR
jgi:hypothetical protein